MKVAVVTDSTSDFARPLAEAHSIAVVPLTVTIAGRDYLDGIEIEADEFYRRNQPATTSQPSPGRFAETYRRLLEENDHVVSIHISQRLSGTYAAALQGAELVAPERIHVIDSTVVSMPLGLLVLAAARLARQGATAAEIEHRVAELASSMSVYFVVATLENLRRGGRIGSASALLGSVLQVKPVLTIRDGEVAPLDRVRTFDRALGRVLELARSADRGQGLCAIVGHAAAADSARKLASELEGISESLLVQPLGPVVGAHAGPGTVGVGCYPAELLPLEISHVAAGASARNWG